MPNRFFAGDRPRLLTEDRPEELRRELERRIKEIDEGTVEMIPGEVFREYLSELERSFRKPKN